MEVEFFSKLFQNLNHFKLCNFLGITGVHFDKERGMWVTQITFQRQCHNLGRFKTIEEAIDARKKAEEEYFGRYRKNKD